MSRAMVVLGAGITSLFVALSWSTLKAADLNIPPRVGATNVPPQCGPCGCPRVTYVYHRSLEATYGAGFDPRSYDETQPHYYFGPMRAYPRYFIEGGPGPGPC
jgi:hypothetical protein